MPAKITFLTVITSFILLVLPWWQNLLQLSLVASAQAGPEPIEVTGFDLISASEGWLRLGQHLYWTRNSGQSWAEITPPNLSPAVIQAIWFVDAQSGWLVLTRLEAPGSIAYSLARTSDGGTTWQVTPLSLFAPGDPDALAEAVHLHFVDAQTGWLVVKRATSRNFSLGALFQTTDGGQTWVKLTLPIGEPVYFATPELGWVAGGPAGDLLYRTRDGGQSWQAQPFAPPASARPGRVLYRLPTFTDNQNGVLPVIVPDGGNAWVEFYLTNDGGNTWDLAGDVSLGREVTAGTVIPLAVLEPRRWLLVTPQGDRLLSLSGSSSTASVISQGDWVEGGSCRMKVDAFGKK